MMASLLLLVIAAGIAGCASEPILSDQGKEVRWLKGDAPKECKELGPVNGSPTHGRFEIAKINIRNATAALGGNLVVVEDVDKESRHGHVVAMKSLHMIGTAYQCPTDIK